MKDDLSNERDPSLLLAIGLTKAILEIEDSKDSIAENNLENTLSGALNTIKMRRELKIQDYDELLNNLKKCKLDHKKHDYEDIIALIKFFKELWLNLQFTHWSNANENTAKIELIGKKMLEHVASILKILPSWTKASSDIKQVENVELKLFHFYEVLISPIEYSKRISCREGKEIKLNNERITKVLSNTSRGSGRRNNRGSAKNGANKTSRINTLPENPSTPKVKSESYKPYFLPAEQLRIMKSIQTFAENDIKLQQIWLSYYINSQFDLNIDNSNQTFQCLILVLEHFAHCEGIQESRNKISKIFLDWSTKKLDSIISLAKFPKGNSIDQIAGLFNDNFFKIFMFLSYLSKTDSEISVESANLALKSSTQIIEINIGKISTPQTEEALYSSLYFLFSFMGKQILNVISIPHLMQNPAIFKENFLLIALWNIDYLIRSLQNIPDESKYPQGALDSIQELITLVSVALNQQEKKLQEYANSLITPEFVKYFINIINAKTKGTISESLGRLIIEITSKDSYYNLKSWQTIIDGLIVQFSRMEENLNSLTIAFIFRLIMCCNNKIEQNQYNETESNHISDIWAKFVPIFFLKNMGKLNYHVLGIILLMKTVLKQKKEEIINQVLIRILKEKEQAKDRAIMIDTFLRVSSLMNVDIQIIKYCNSIITHIISNGKEQDKKFEEFTKADLTASFPKLFDLCKTLPIGEQNLTFDNLFSIENDKVNKSLLEQALGCEGFLINTDVDKAQSLSYYIKMLINFMVEHAQGGGLELMQEKLLALLQYYFSFNCEPTFDLNRFVFLNAVTEMYILFADYLLSKGERFAEKQAILEFSQMAAEHMLEIFDVLALRYFKCALKDKSFFLNENLSNLLANVWLLSGNIIEIKDADFEHISNIQSQSTLKDISNKLSCEELKEKDASQKAQHYSVSILESHLATHTPCKTRSELHFIEKAMLSTIQLLTSILPTCFRLFSDVPQATKELVLKLFIKAELPVFPECVQESIRTSAIEMCKAIGIPQNLAVSLHHATNGLMQMFKITQFLNQTIESQFFDSTLSNKLMNILLNRWKTSFHNAYSACATEEVLKFAQELAMNNLINSIKNVYQLLNSNEIEENITIQIINIISECIEGKDEILKNALQEITLAFDEKKIKQILLIPGKECKFQELLTKIAKNNVPLQDKLYDILIKHLVSEELPNEDCLYSHLGLLEKIVLGNRGRFVSRILEDLFAWSVSCKSGRLQEILLDYFATICCKGLSVEYPKGEKSYEDNDIQDAELEGYGVFSFERKEEAVKPGNYCTFSKTKKHFEIQPSYHCYTCNLMDSKGCCSVCAKKCHKGHNVLFWKICSFYCDCHGEGKCKAMPRDYEHSDDHSENMLIKHYIEQRERERESEREREREREADRERFIIMGEDSSDQIMEEWKEKNPQFTRISKKVMIEHDGGDNDIEREFIEKMIRMQKGEDSSDSEPQVAISKDKVESQVVSDASQEDKSICVAPRDIPYERTLYSKPTMNCKHKLKQKDSSKAIEILLQYIQRLTENYQQCSFDKFLMENPRLSQNMSSYDSNLFFVELRKAKLNSAICVLTQTFDIQPPSYFSKRKPVPYRESASALRSYTAKTPVAKNCITSNKSGIIAIVQKDQILFYSSECIDLDPSKKVESDRVKNMPRGQIQLPFNVCSVCFNEMNDSFLAVTGIKDCQVFTIEPSTGKIVSKLTLDLMFSSLGNDCTITKVQWVPSSQTHLAVVANIFIKIYDLSEDAIIPPCIITSNFGNIKDISMYPQEGQDKSCNIFVLSMGNFVSQIEVKINRNTKDSIIEISEATPFSEKEKNLIKDNQIIAIYFSKKNRMIFLSLDNGKLLFSKLENCELSKCAAISLDDECKSLTSLTEINTDDNKITIAGLAQFSQLKPVIIQIEEKEVNFQPLKNKAEGIRILQNTKCKPMRILVLSDDTNLLSFAVKEPDNVLLSPSIIINDMQLSQLIEKTKLPHTVSMPVDFFEKAINVADSMSKKLRITGNICQVLGKDSAGLIDLLVMNKESSHSTLRQLHTNIEITLDDNDYVFIGLRINADQSSKQFIEIFNRKQQLKQSHLTDICLCDAEIFSITNNSLKFSLVSEDAPIKLNKIEIYVMQKTQFHFNEKLSKFEKWIMAHSPNKLMQFSENSRIYQTKSIKSISWKTKEQLLKDLIPENSIPRKIISAFDLLCLLCYTSSPLQIQQANDILKILSDNAFMGIVDDNRYKVMQSTIRKCAKAIIYNVCGAQESVEGNQFNYCSFKINAIFNWHGSRPSNMSVDLQTIDKSLTLMKKLSQKARIMLFEYIYTNHYFLTEFGTQIRNLMKKDNQNTIKRVFENYVYLIILWCDSVLNYAYYSDKTTGKSLKDASSAFLLNEGLINNIKTWLLPFLLDTNEEYNGIMFNCLIEQSKKHDIEFVYTSEKLIVKSYARSIFSFTNEDAMKDIEKNTPTPNEIKSFDFSFVLLAATTRSIILDCQKDPDKLCVLLNFLYKLIHNMQAIYSQIESIGMHIDCYISDYISLLLDSYIIPYNILDYTESQCILLSVLFIIKIFESQSNTHENYIFDYELVLKPIFEKLVQGNILLSWIMRSLNDLHCQIFKKIKLDDISSTEDINSEVHLLEAKNDYAKEWWSLFFNKQQQEKAKKWENIEQQVAIALLDLASNLGYYEQHLISKNVKLAQPGILLNENSSEQLKEQIKKLKESACIFIATQGIQPKLKESAKRLYILFSESKNELHLNKDQYLYSLTFQALKLRISEQDESNIYKSLTSLWKIASKRSINLKQYLRKNNEDFKLLFQVANNKNNKIAFNAMSLVCLALETGESPDFNIKTTYQNIYSANIRPKDYLEKLKRRPQDNSMIIDEGFQYDEEIFKLGLNFANTHILTSANFNLRFAAAHILKGLWDSGNVKQKNEIIRIVIQKFSAGIHNYGFALLQLFLVAVYLVHRETDQKDAYIKQLCKIVSSEAQQAVSIMQQHENGEIYRQVQKMIGNKEQSGDKKDFVYCLDPVPCGVCAFEKEEPYSTIKIGDIKDETKFYESGYIYKLTNSYSIQKVSLNLDLKGGKFVKVFNVYASNSKVTDLTELKNNRSLWKKVGTAQLKPDLQSCTIEFALPLISSLIQFEFVVGSGPIKNRTCIRPRQRCSRGRRDRYMEDLHIIDSDSIICPRCSSSVSSNAGICLHCGENAYQCIHCHNINYDKLDALICTDCGHSRYGKIDISLSAKQTFAPEKIASEKEKQNLQAKLSSTMETAMKLHESLTKNRGTLQSIIATNSVKSTESSRSLVDIYDIYMNNCVIDYRKLVKLLQNVNAMKAELMLYRNQIIITSEHTKLTTSEKCYGCAEAYLQLFLKIIEITAPLPVWTPTLYQLNTSELLLNKIMPCLSPYLAQKLICSLVSLGLYSKEFAFVIFEFANNSLIQIKNDSIMKRNEAVISIELLMQLHAKATKEIIIDQNVDKSIYLLFSKTNETLWNFLIAAAQNTNENLFCAEEVIQPILVYLNEIFSIKFCSDIVSPQIMKTVICSENILEKWANLPKISLIHYKENLMESWIKNCLLHPECKLLRETTEKLLKKILKKTPLTIIPTTVGMLNILDKVFERNRDDTESYMSILRFCILELKTDAETINQQWAIIELMRHGDKELNKLLKIQESLQFREELLGEDLWIGYTLFKVYEIVLEIAQAKDGKKIVSASEEEIGHFAIGAYIKVKKLLLLANNYIEKTQQKIDEIFKNMQTENIEDRKKFIRQCILLLSENKGDEQAAAFLYEELYKFINPEKPEPVYSLNLRKAPTQDVYIKGAMNKNPYLSSELGVTMKDLRTKICKELGMTEAEEIMELLVGNQLIDLELPIKLVYEKVWWPFSYKKKNPETEEIPSIDPANKSDLEPMQVIFRLAGIDGEATEKRVENLNDSKEQEDPELAYAITSVFADNMPAMTNEASSGLSIMLEHFSRIASLSKQKVISERIIKLFSIIIKTKVCRTKILELGGTNVLAEKLVEFLPFYESAEGPIVDSLILIVGDIINEANQSGTALSVCSSVVDTGHITKIMERLISTCEKSESPKFNTKQPLKYVGALTRILPFFAYGNNESTIILVNYFKDWISLGQSGEGIMNHRSKFHMARLIEIIESVSEKDLIIRDALLSLGVTEKVVKFVFTFLNLPVVELESIFQKMFNEIQASLKILNGMVKGHMNTQLYLLNCQILGPIYNLSLVKFKNKQAKDIGLLFEILIEEFTKEPPVCKEAANFVKHEILLIKNEKKLQSERKKAEVMRQLNIKTASKMLLPKVDASVFGRTNMEVSDVFQCGVCHDGYTAKPGDLLGAYVFTIQSNVRGNDNFAEKYSPSTGIATVTHFNLIHMSCHMNAVMADKSMRPPKSEWEGATIRNAHTKCNNLFPIRGGTVTNEVYSSAFNRYFNNMRGIVKTEQPKFKVIVNDLKSLLKKFAYEESFSHHSQGGGPVHNIQLIPFIIYMALFLLTNEEEGFSIKNTDKGVQSFFAAVSEISKENLGQPNIKIAAYEENKGEENDESELMISADDFAYICSTFLVILGQNLWIQSKLKLAQAAINIGIYMAKKQITGKKRHKKGTVDKLIDISESVKVNESTGLAKVMKEIRPMLILLCLVEALKKQQIELIEYDPPTYEEYIKNLSKKIMLEHVKVNEGILKINQVYTTSFLEFKTVKDFLQYLNLPEEEIQRIQGMLSTIITEPAS